MRGLGGGGTRNEQRDRVHAVYMEMRCEWVRARMQGAWTANNVIDRCR